jgi:outer membrane beta-barrel protein
MEGRIRVLLLRAGPRAVLAMALLVLQAGCSLLPGGRGSVDPAADQLPEAPAPVIDPRVERREVSEPKIDTEDFEVQAFAGLINVEDFGSNTVYGARLAYHVSESLFVEATYGKTSDVDRTSFEVLTNLNLLGSDRSYEYYDISLGWNLLPGEVFLGRNLAFNTALYLVAGAGNTSFHDEDLFTLTFGAGYRVLVTDSIALHFDVRDHLFDDDITGDDKTTHNVEFGLGLSWFF